MAKHTPLRWVLRLCLEMLLWSISAVAFLYLYIHVFHASSSAALPHLKFLTALWLTCASLRILLWQNTRTGLARIGAGLLAGTPLFLLLLYYLAAAVGLNSWGRIITWPLLKTYLLQTPQLLEVLGIPAWQPLLGVILLLAAILAIGHWLSRYDWSQALAQRLSQRTARLIAPAVLLGGSIVLLDFGLAPPGAQQEPISLSFFGEQFEGIMQTHRLNNSPLRDEAERKARNTLQESPRSLGQSNIIIIVGDAARADHMGVYGYARNVTPGLDALYQQAAGSKARARSVCAESSCGLMALAGSRSVDNLPEHPVTLYEVLAHHGWETHLILAGDHTNFYGLKNAYGKVDHYSDGLSQSNYYVNDDRIVIDGSRKLPHHRPEQPVFIQYHLMSTHALGSRDNKAEAFNPQENYSKWQARNNIKQDLRIQAAVNYYDNGMLGFDRTIGHILEILGEKGYLENAIVLITGDHGEMLGEHGMVSHARGLYEGVLNIPLIALHFGSAPRIHFPAHIVSQIDIAPTLLAAFGIQAPASWDGIAVQAATKHDFLFIHQAPLAGLYDLRQPGSTYKYLRDSDGSWEQVYELVSDPQESRNLLKAISKAQLNEWRRQILTRTPALANSEVPELEQ